MKLTKQNTVEAPDRRKKAYQLFVIFVVLGKIDIDAPKSFLVKEL